VAQVAKSHLTARGTTLIILRMEPMLCPHCARGIDWKIIAAELARSAENRNPTTNERTQLLDWLENWRREIGFPPANLKGRSTAQLQKMRSEALKGGGYRLGRKWKVDH
jgi:hypothetical protein